MISKNELKYYSSLNIKKFRNQEEKFLVEGKKIVYEGISAGYNCEVVFMTNKFLSENDELIDFIKKRQIKLQVIKTPEFERISDTRSPQGIAAVFDVKKNRFDIKKFTDADLVVYLDNIADPGNAGTIIRTCDWFGIRNILLSNKTVEFLSPKVIRSSMGSIFHTNIFSNSENFLPELKKAGYKIICTDLTGTDIYKMKIPSRIVVVLSGESSGPSESIKQIADEKVTIPGEGKAESLNVASAAAIILSHLTR